MKKVIKYFLFVLLFISYASYAQELNCTVKVSAQKLQTTDPRIFQTLQKALTDFMNNRKWTTDIFATQEKVECSFLVTITSELGGNKFGAQLTVQANRPVYNSSYNSTMLNIVDVDVTLEYLESQPIEYSDNSGSNTNFTSILAYYAYIILGLDYDSFAPNGGAQWYAKAMNIVSLNQNSTEVGWKGFEKPKNRYWMAENLTNSKYDQIHTALYGYHRQGLDKMFDDPDAGRAAVMDALNLIDKMNSDNPGTMIVGQFFAAKADELTNIYSKAGQTEKATAVTLLSKLDPTNAQRYQKIMK
jgi:hypothetical protein